MPDREPLDVLDAIHSTRAIRYLKPDPIPDDVLWAILDAAIRGPTGGNRQSWGWLVVRDSEVKRRIAEYYRARLGQFYGYESFSDAELAGGRRILGGTVQESEVGIDVRNRRAVMHLAQHFGEAPVIVAPVLENATAGPDTRAGGAALGSSVYGAVQNLMLAARAHGVGSVFTWGLHDALEFNELLALPETARVMCLVPLGYPARGAFAQPKRQPVEAVVHWDRWGHQRTRSG